MGIPEKKIKHHLYIKMQGSTYPPPDDPGQVKLSVRQVDLSTIFF